MPRPARSLDTVAPALCIAALLLLPGCRKSEPLDGGQPAVSEAPLPGPQQIGGAITDMPAAPGPGAVPLSGPGGVAPPADGASALPPLEQNPEAGLVPLVAVDPGDVPGGTATPAASTPLPATPPAPEASAPASAPEDPRDLLRGYYAAINAGDFATAHASWADGGPASPAQLAASHADARSIELTLGAPRPAEGAAGSVYVEVPVTVTTTRHDGNVQHQAGRYTLRRSQADGATAAQRAWRITAVDLRDAAR